MADEKNAGAAVLFEGIPAVPDPFVKKSWTLTGPGHGAYLGFRSCMSGYTIRTYGRQVTEDVDPALIEGMLVGPDDIACPERFWRQHMPLGTAGTFTDIARQLPAARAVLDAGTPLEDLMRDPWLGKCAGIYLATRRPDALLLIKGPGFYWFQSNGRHRAIAARLAGLESIPAAVIGEITKKTGG